MNDPSIVSKSASPPSEFFKLAFSELQRITDDLVQLLKAVDVCGWNLYEGPALQLALWRYETMWLPLLAAVTISSTEFRKAADSTGQQPQPTKNPHFANLRTNFAPFINSISSEDLRPPLDVAWVWYLHRLTPLQYLEDVSKVAGCPIAPNVSSAFKFLSDNESPSARAWNAAFAKSRSEDVRVRYFPDYLASIYSSPGKVVRRALVTGSVRRMPLSSLMLYDISGAAKLHRGTLSVVLRSEVANPGYFVRAITRYDDFMRLQAMHKHFLYVPEDVSFIWRAHAASTADYLNDDLIGRALSSRTGIEKSNIAHPQAREFRTEHLDTLFDAPLSKEATAQIWKETYGDSKGSFLVPTAEARSRPGQHRDGYLQDCLQEILEGSGVDSDDGDILYDGGDRLAGQPTMLSRASGAPVTTLRVGTHKSNDRNDCRSLRSGLEGTTTLAKAATRLTANSKGPSIRSKLTFRLANRTEDTNVGVPLDDAVDNRKHEGDRPNALGRRDAAGQNEAKPAGTNQKRERHLATQKQKLGHGGRKKANAGLDRAQWLRGLTLCAAGFIFVIFGIIYMRKLPKTSISGVLLFLTGLAAFLLAALIWLRPDHERRHQKKEDRKRRREAKEADEREKQEKEANSKKYLEGVHMHSFVSNEAMIAIGGEGLVHLPGATVADSFV